MTEVHTRGRTLFNGWRLAGWGALAALLCLPAVAMQLTGEVDWTASDFVFAAVLLTALGTGVEVALRVGRSARHKVAIALAALALRPVLGGGRNASGLYILEKVQISVAGSSTA